MGANQSSGGSSGDHGAPVEIKTSYYELLEVDRQATEDEIKKAYRRKALELHPDRNYGKEEEATRLFAEIQTAYDVLSDPQERAWYDSHEAVILRGGAGDGEEHFEHNMRVTTADDVTAWMAKFHGRVDMSDSPNGFFGFLRECFERLSKEEQAAADWDGVEIPDYPPFGHKDDEYEDVVKDFYAAWSGFSTKKKFSWKDKYRTSEAPDRRHRRAMEKENKKLRDDSIREFNDAVRTLVGFVRKRDPRYTPNMQTDAERQKALQNARKEQAAKARAANAVKIAVDAVPEWAKTRDPEELEESEEEDVEEEQFECVACNKVFKSEKQFDAHEKSKKHQKAVYALRKKMQKDGQRLGLSDNGQSSGAITPQEDDTIIGVHTDTTPEIRKLDIEDHEDDSDQEAPNSGSDTDVVRISTPLDSEEDDSDSDDDYAPRSAVINRLNPTDEATAPEPEPSTTDEANKGEVKKKIGKAAQKRAKKAAKQAATNAEDLRFKCATCNTVFPSRTQLFDHIRDQKHEALKTETTKRGFKGKKR